jgi:hypothetical protein
MMRALTTAIEDRLREAQDSLDPADAFVWAVLHSLAAGIVEDTVSMCKEQGVGRFSEADARVLDNVLLTAKDLRRGSKI